MATRRPRRVALNVGRGLRTPPPNSRPALTSRPFFRPRKVDAQDPLRVKPLTPPNQTIQHGGRRARREKPSKPYPARRLHPRPPSVSLRGAQRRGYRAKREHDIPLLPVLRYFLFTYALILSSRGSIRSVYECLVRYSASRSIANPAPICLHTGKNGKKRSERFSNRLDSPRSKTLTSRAAFRLERFAWSASIRTCR